MKLDEMLKRARDMQARVEEAQAGLKTASATGESGGGLVKVKLNGSHEALAVDIEPAALEEDRAVLEDLIAAAINDGVRRVAALQKEHMSVVAAKLGLPPGIKLPL